MKSLNEISPYSPVSPKLTPIIAEVCYNKCKISGNRQCILGQGKLVMVLVQLTLCKIIIHDFNIYFRQINLRMPRLPRAICLNFTYVRHG